MSALIKEAIREDLAEEAEDLATIRERAGERGISFVEVMRNSKL